MRENSFEKVNISLAKPFKENISKAAILMERMRTNEMEIPNGAGFMLVRVGTPSAKEREQEKGIIVAKEEIGGEGFYVCRR